MATFLEYVPGKSVLHRMNPVAKLAFAFLFALSCFMTSNLVYLGVLLVAAFILAVSCKMTQATAGLLKAVFFFSLILAIVQILTTPTGTRLVGLPWGYIGTGSLIAALTTIVRLSAAAIPLFLTFYVTKINDITNAMVKVCHVPYKYAFTFSSAVHFIPVFLKDMSSIIEVQTARGVEFDKGGLVNKFRLIVPLCVHLLVGSVRRTNSAAVSAELRGFNLRTRESGLKQYPFSVLDTAALVGGVALLMGALLQ